MRAERALGMAGRAAGIENRRIVVGVDRDLRERHIGQRGIIGRRADQILQPRRPALQRAGRTRNHDPLHRGERRSGLDQPLMPLIIDEQQTRARIVDAIFQLAGGPPRVQRHDDRADRGGSEEDHRPFGQVAHRDRNPITLRHTHFQQLRRQRRDGTVIRFIGDALVLIDGEDILPIGAGGLDQEGERRRRIFPYPGRHAANLGHVHFELAARHGQRGLRLRQRDHGPAGVERDERFDIQDASLHILNFGFGLSAVPTKVSVDSRATQGNRVRPVSNRGYGKAR